VNLATNANVKKIIDENDKLYTNNKQLFVVKNNKQLFMLQIINNNKQIIYK
jgi:hypothetical protein